LFLLAGCGEAPVEQERFAFLAPDNQTGEAAFDWTTAVIHRGLAAAVGSSAATDTIAEARVSNVANRVVYNTLERGPDAGELRLHSSVFDPNGHRFVREYTVTGNSLQVINRMARNLTNEPYPLGIKTEDELRKWPVPTGDAQAFESKCIELAEAEPAFGAALGGCLDVLVAVNKSDAVRAILSKVPDETSKDFPPEIQYAFAQGYMALKEYAKAVPLYRLASPNRPGIKNLLGYAEALSGDCDAGMKALAEYAQYPEAEANAYDSMGEISFFCGQFKNAEQYFQKSAPLWKNNEGQLEPMKAAAARSMTGDVVGANQLATTQLDKLKKSNPQVATALEPVWKAIMQAPATERQRRIEATLIHRP
jgi:tetratricopeptide (TPR) repeat protein